MIEFFAHTGKMAIGSRLRLLSEKVTADAAAIYRLYGLEFKPKWFPVFFVLSRGEPMTVTDLATRVGQTHPAVIFVVRELSARGLVKEKKTKSDGRKNLIELSPAGKKLASEMSEPLSDVNKVVEDLLSQTRSDLWKALEEWEFLLEQKSLFDRVRERRKDREGDRVRIVEYESKYKQTFKVLNEEWILKYFRMESADVKVLNNPEKYIIEPGGQIFVALLDDQPVGVCALKKMIDGPYDYELAKMAVRHEAQGRNIGWLLGKAVVDKARELGGTTLFLESNTILKPAIQLYLKLGFERVRGHATPYERSNIQMVLSLLKSGK